MGFFSSTGQARYRITLLDNDAKFESNEVCLYAFSSGSWVTIGFQRRLLLGWTTPIGWFRVRISNALQFWGVQLRLAYAVGGAHGTRAEGGGIGRVEEGQQPAEGNWARTGKTSGRANRLTQTHEPSTERNERHKNDAGDARRAEGRTHHTRAEDDTTNGEPYIEGSTDEEDVH